LIFTVFQAFFPKNIGETAQNIAFFRKNSALNALFILKMTIFPIRSQKNIEKIYRIVYNIP